MAVRAAERKKSFCVWTAGKIGRGVRYYDCRRAKAASQYSIIRFCFSVDHRCRLYAQAGLHGEVPAGPLLPGPFTGPDGP
jgi:hypothetical protein